MFASLLSRSTRAYYQETLQEDQKREARPCKKAHPTRFPYKTNLLMRRTERAASN